VSTRTVARGPVTGDTRPLGVRLTAAWRELTGREPVGRAGLTTARVSRRSSFKGAEVSRLVADWMVSAGPPDRELSGDMRLLRARARELRRNNPYIRQYVNLLKANVLGHSGFQLQAQVRNSNGELLQDVNHAIERGFRLWAGSPVSADGRLPLNEMAQLALETTAGDGETFVRLIEDQAVNRFGLALQLIDADLVDEGMNAYPSTREPEVRLGVEIDRWGRATGYWINEQPSYTPGNPQRTWQRYRVPAAEILHIYRPMRPNQSRGITWFAPAMFAIQQLNGLTEAELVASRGGAAKMGFIVTKDPTNASSPADDGTGEEPTPVELEANPGSIEELQPGQEFQAWDPNHPTTAFADFVKTVLRQIATGLGVSYNALANDLENVNYSSIRSGLLIERDLWRMLQSWWEASFMTPVYRRWLNAALLTGELQLRNRDWRLYTDVRWQKRGWPWVDPKNDLEAGELALRLRLTSRSRILAETGDDYEEVLEEQAAEEKLAKAKGISLEPAAAPQPAPDDEDAPDDEESGARSRTARRPRFSTDETQPAANGSAH